MARYLTPAKIGLLALIELYAEEAVPNDAIIPVLSFLASHILDSDLQSTTSTSTPGAGAAANRWQRAERSIGLVVSVKDFENLLLPFPAVDRLPGRRLWDRFLEKLWGIDSLDALQEFFSLRPRVLARTREELRRMAEAREEPPSGILLARNSPLGAFVRKAVLEFTRLQFHHSAELWKAFVKYRQPTVAYWRRRNPQCGRLSFDSVLMEGQHEWGPFTDGIAVTAYGGMLMGQEDDALPVSTDDVESLLEFQIDQIQKYGARVPAEIKAKFHAMLRDSHVVPSLSHYLNFSDAWRSGDYPSAFDYLHRYFDYTMQNRDRLFYHYALMNLAIVQSDFGCHKEAMATMLETISTARENKDNTCLNFCLNWFYHFGRAHPDLVQDLEANSMIGSGKEALAFLRAKAKETGMLVLRSSALLSEAKLNMANGESIAGAMEHLVRSSQIIVERNMKSLFGSQLSVTTSLWDRLGISYLSSMTSEVFLRVHAPSACFDDELKMVCRLAGTLAGKGKYDEAFAKLEDGIDKNALRAAKPNQYWHLYRGLVKLRRDLHRNDLDTAETLLAQLLQVGSEELDPDVVFIIDSLHIEALIRRKDFDAAYEKIERLVAKFRDDHRDLSLRIRLLLVKAHLFDAMGMPERAFSITMRAASLAWRARLLTLLWQAVGALANILNAMGEFPAAVQLVEAVLPRSMESENAFNTGMLYSILADARMGQAGKAGKAGRAAATTTTKGEVSGLAASSVTNNNKRDVLFKKADEALECAYKHFSAAEDLEKQCETLAKRATLMKVLGNHARAEELAARYMGLRRESSSRDYSGL
ncbi:hypothetical protein SMACR_05407 [Sordaria macrospora]|uniref:Anaphase-promoting complex subunit 5 n=2 Tax=Sordaria macrospora TaxID=5147 RepID=F7VSV0_SORMK|nr:putative APC5 protein [Sordaria macrospora k-hell]KAA8630686.1 hypothetical protein SMACR_05407 [Sordaria macrospora]KAH7628450.1 putative APC5 protein [Sordaria sp. MPI-SDFR-AT-0083]WPJ57601.1 hypothetical protein SMAC4_05407 [Sordaria macrospora]CCC08767.1 putative APC5 protein [Sordaria macrospora k-hell]